MNKIEEKISDLEKRQSKQGWNRDRAWQIGRLKQARDGKLDDVRLARKEQSRFAVHTESIIEQEFAARAKEAGWVISKRGWPDFFMWKDGRLACVEVKGDLEILRSNQKAVLEALASYGVPCYTWRPLEGFKRVSGAEANMAVRAAL